MKNIYEDGKYFEQNPLWHTERSPWKAGKIISILSKNKIEFTSIADVGCGAGEVLNQLQKNIKTAKKFSGYEISPQGFQMTKSRENETLKFYNDDLFSQPESVTFDIVMAIDVFEHVEDYFSFLRNIKQRGIYKIFHIPLDLSVQSVLRSKPISEKRKKVGHIHYFTKDIIFDALKDLNYEIVDWQFTGDTLELPAKSKLSALAKVPRKLFFAIDKKLAVRFLGGWSLLVLAK
jgi:SAM-dependent methyltransferase